jgi:hypothetical protein
MAGASLSSKHKLKQVCRDGSRDSTEVEDMAVALVDRLVEGIRALVGKRELGKGMVQGMVPGHTRAVI